MSLSHKVNLKENKTGGWSLREEYKHFNYFQLLNFIYCLPWYLCYMKIMLNYPESPLVPGVAAPTWLAYILAIIKRLYNLPWIFSILKYFYFVCIKTLSTCEIFSPVFMTASRGEMDQNDETEHDNHQLSH